MNARRIRRAQAHESSRLAEIEAACFPIEEAATEQSLGERLAVYGEHIWVMEEANEIIAFIDGPTLAEDTISDEVFSNPNCHTAQGAWQAILGINTLANYRRQDCAGALIRHFIAQAKKEGKRGVILTCKKELLSYYERFGFENLGISKSIHGGAVWYDMKLEW